MTEREAFLNEVHKTWPEFVPGKSYDIFYGRSYNGRDPTLEEQARADATEKWLKSGGKKDKNTEEGPPEPPPDTPNPPKDPP